ncbi:CinA family protein [Halomonas sp. HNIBRBA4712]|uniref:CinA family protein n=1 Tax=Halomonas sp. HNIBRBA4712 TaxID=3373087 RepID=UPI00374672E6
MTADASGLKNLDLTLLARRLGKRCTERGFTLTTAESCTGGGIASMITSAPGSSAYFETGFVTYSNQAKTRLLGVASETLDAHGAVSEAVVNEMVRGACRESGAALGVAVSGVAGPGGGSADKPVGLVWLSVGSEREQRAQRFVFPGDRAAVREQAVREALIALMLYLGTDGQA